MGNQSSQLGSGVGNAAGLLRRRHRTTDGNETFNFQATIDEEATEVNEDSEPLSIISTGKDDDETATPEESDSKRYQPFHIARQTSNDSTAVNIENYIHGTSREDGHATFGPKSEPSKPDSSMMMPLRAPKRRNRASTLGPTQGALIREQMIAARNKNVIPTVFKLYWPRDNAKKNIPKEVFVGGSFNNWSLVPMKGSLTGHHWCIIIDLPEGAHEYKFKVDDTWVHNPREKTMDDGMGGKNNVIVVHKTDFEVFDALDMDCRDVEARKKSLRPVDDSHGEYGQEVPAMFKSSNQPNACFPPPPGTQQYQKQVHPPILPPHLLQIILNKDTPLSCEPTLLPRPNHVMLNHMYALAIKDKVMVMSATKRFKKKYVTTVLYRPIDI